MQRGKVICGVKGGRNGLRMVGMKNFKSGRRKVEGTKRGREEKRENFSNNKLRKNNESQTMILK